MRQISSGELARIQSSQLETLHDTCIIQTFSSSGSNTFGSPVVTYTDGSPVKCALWENNGIKEYRGNVILTEADATLRLPANTVITTKDRVKITYIYGSPVTGSFIYAVYSEPKNGLSGQVVELKRFST
jgi:hypothetical protein